MTRVKNGNVARARRKKVLKQAKGYFGSKHRLYKTAQEQLFHSGAYAYRDRKNNKRNFRKLWITRINAACELNDISYSRFINGLNISGIEINRKMLSELAIDNPGAFSGLVKLAKEGLNGKKTKPEIKVEPKVEVKKIKEPEAKEEKELELKVEKPATKKVDTDLSSKTLVELKELAKAKKITGYSTMKKADLVKVLN